MPLLGRIASGYTSLKKKTSSPPSSNFDIDTHSSMEILFDLWWLPTKGRMIIIKMHMLIKNQEENIIWGEADQEDIYQKGSIKFSLHVILFMYSKHIILMWKYFMSKIRCSLDFKSFVSYILSENMFCSDICLKICSTSLKLGICLASSKREKSLSQIQIKNLNNFDMKKIITMFKICILYAKRWKHCIYVWWIRW